MSVALQESEVHAAKLIASSARSADDFLRGNDAGPAVDRLSIDAGRGAHCGPTLEMGSVLEVQIQLLGRALEGGVSPMLCLITFVPSGSEFGENGGTLTESTGTSIGRSALALP